MVAQKRHKYICSYCGKPNNHSSNMCSSCAEKSVLVKYLVGLFGVIKAKCNYKGNKNT